MPKQTLNLWFDYSEFKVEGDISYSPFYYDRAKTKPAGGQVARSTNYTKEDGLNYYNDFTFFYFHTSDSPNPNPSPIVDTIVVPFVDLFNTKEPVTAPFPRIYTQKILWGNGKYQNVKGTLTVTQRKGSSMTPMKFEIEY